MRYSLSVLLILCVFQFGHLQENFNLELVSQTSLGAIANDVWGYVDSSDREYAIVGTRSNSQIYSLSNPEKPILLKSIPGVSSIWRDFKSYGNYLYGVADQGREGLTIIDMSLAPDSISFTRWSDTIFTNPSPAPLERCHNLFIDPEGVAYLSGCNPGNGGVILLDLKNNPLSPEVIGIQDEAYAHDAIAQGNRLYTSEIFEGNLGIYDIEDRVMPLFIARQNTSSSFTHNAWPSDDGKYIFTTDERVRGYVDAYNISDLDNIILLDKYRPNDKEFVLPHNTHYDKGFLVTSWYTEGLIVIDANRPHNLIRVAQYDTNPQNANGNWGAFPYLPSGLILVSDMDNGLFVLRPSYRQAAYLEGMVLDKDTKEPINNAQIEIISEYGTAEYSGPDGTYATGVPFSGILQVVVSHPDYINDTVSINLIESVLTNKNFELEQKAKFTVTGRVSDKSGNALGSVKIIFTSKELNSETISDQTGTFEINLVQQDYDVYFGKWGYKHTALTLGVDESKILSIQLEEGYQDDFFADLGWTLSGDALRGQWVRAIPQPTFFSGTLSNPDKDADDDIGKYCYVTGNNTSSVGADDVDDGTTSLTSPEIDLTTYSDPVIQFQSWFFNDGGASTPNDKMEVFINDGNSKIPVLSISDTSINTFWINREIKLREYTDSNIITMIVEASDDMERGHIVEAGIDAFRLVDQGTTTNTSDLSEEMFRIWPNPATDHINLSIPQSYRNSLIKIIDVNGREMISVSLEGDELDISMLNNGYFIIHLFSEGGSVLSVPFAKVSNR